MKETKYQQFARNYHEQLYPFVGDDYVRYDTNYPEMVLKRIQAYIKANKLPFTATIDQVTRNQIFVR